MPNIGAVLKEEIRRLARKEIKEAIARLRKDNAALKRAVADHKRRVAELEKLSRRLLSETAPLRQEAAAATPNEVQNARISGAMIKKVRERLGLSQADMARLLGVTGQSVYQWERRQGRLSLRGNTKAAIVEARKLGKREVKRRLEASGESGDAPAKAARKPRRKKASKRAAPAKRRGTKGRG